MINLAILSSPILLEDGTFHRAEITLDQAKTLINAFDTTNYTQHSSCLLLGVEPAKERVTCESYDVAIVVKPNTRLQYGREYTVEEIEDIGYKIVVIWKQSVMTYKSFTETYIAESE